MNVPLGIVALVVTSSALKMPHVRRDHTIDYLGAALVVASVTSVLLYTAWAGPEHGWGSAPAWRCSVAGLLLAVVFVLVELRAVEPIIPMRLFRNSIFSIANAFGFLIGIAMFGSMIFIPVYLQVVNGMSPTESGLAMLPMVVGLFTHLDHRRADHVAHRPLQVFPHPARRHRAVALLMLSRLDGGLALLVRRDVDVRDGRRSRPDACRSSSSSCRTPWTAATWASPPAR